MRATAEVLRPGAGPKAHLSLRRGVYWALAGNIVYAASQWGILTVLAKFCTPADVGHFMLGLAITTPVMLFCSLQLRAVQATDAAQEFMFGDYLALRLVCTAGALVLIAAIVWVDYQKDVAWVILLLGAVKAVDSLSDIIYGHLQQREQMAYIARSFILRGVLSFVALSATVYVTHNLFLGLAAMCAAWAAVLFLHDTRQVRSDAPHLTGGLFFFTQPRWRWGVLRRLSWLALPMGIALLFSNLTVSIPRYFVEHYQGAYSLGIFGAIAYVVTAGNQIVQALGQAISPRMAQYFAEANYRSFCKLQLKLLVVAAILGGVGISVALLFGKQLLTLLYTPEYSRNQALLVWVMLAGAITYLASMLGYGLTATRFFHMQLPLSVLMVITTVIASVLLIPHFGMTGAVYCQLIQESVQFVVTLVILGWIVLKLKRTS